MKRIISLCLAVLLLATVFLSFAVPSYSAGEKTKRLPLDIFRRQNWIAVEGVADISEKKASGASLLTVSGEENATFASITGEFEPYDLSEYTEAVFRLAVRGDGEKYSLDIALSSEDSSYVFSAEVDNQETELYIPLDGGFKSSFSKITVSASSADQSISYINLISFTVDNTYTYSYKSVFSSDDVYGEGSFTRTPSDITVMPENGEIVTGFDFSEVYTAEESILVWVKISPSSQGSICAETTDAEGNVAVFSQQNISYNGTYAFLVNGGFEDFRLRLTLADKSAGATFTGAGIYKVGAVEKSYGSIASCRYDGKRISVSGSLSKEATTEYNGSRILLYAIPATEVSNCDLTKLKPVAFSGFSTKFRINCELDKTYAEYFYKIVLDTEDGLLPVGTVCAPSSGISTQSTGGNISALYGADAADAFETNVSSVIMDFCAGRLLENEDIYSAQIYNYKKTYYFNKKYLEELDDRMRFYSAAGVKVYLRFYSDRDGYAFDYSADSAESISLMCAVSGFISEHYPQIAGYIIGVGANEHTTSLSPEHAEARARLFAVFSESVRAKNPSAQIIVPYTSTGTDAYLTCALVSHYLSEYKAGATVSMYETAKDAQGAYSNATQLSSIASQLGAASNGAAVLWNVPSTLSAEEITDGYRALCVNSQAHGLRLSALSVKRADKSALLYDSLKSMLDTENLIAASISQFTPSGEDTAFSGSFAFWDFTSSYDTAGWVSGGSFSTPVTAKGQNGGRVMMAESSGVTEGAGILICRTDFPLDLSDIGVRVSFSVMSEKLSEAEVTVIFGSGETRAEFFADVECNKEISLVCDMKEFSGGANVDYAALIVRGDESTEAHVSKIELCSNSKSNEVLEEQFSPAAPEEHNPLLYVIIIFLMAGTVTVFSVLWKKQSLKKGAVNK